ncbi:hypothetical protein MTO96_051556 [Rhipicephalus appendiculatus]
MDSTIASAIESSMVKSDISAITESEAESSSQRMFAVTIAVFCLIACLCFGIFIFAMAISGDKETTMFDEDLDLSGGKEDTKPTTTTEKPLVVSTEKWPTRKPPVVTTTVVKTPSMPTPTTTTPVTTTTPWTTSTAMTITTPATATTPSTITPPGDHEYPEHHNYPYDKYASDRNNSYDHKYACDHNYACNHKYPYYHNYPCDHNSRVDHEEPDYHQNPGDHYSPEHRINDDHKYPDSRGGTGASRHDGVHSLQQDTRGIRKLQANAVFFLRQAQQANRTKYGASFAFTHNVSAADFMTEKFDQAIYAIVRYHVGHYGFLNLYREFSTPTAVTNALLVLKRIDDFLKRLQARWRPLHVLGLSIDFVEDYKTVDVMRTVFVPSMFIAIGHISYSDAGFPDCTILPPNILVYPNSLSSRTNKTYGHTLNDTLPILERVYKSHPKLPLSISVTLSGRYYAPKRVDTSQRYLPFEDCTDFRGPRYDDPANVCPSVAGAEWKFQKNHSYHYEALLNYNRKLTFTFDSIDSLKLKVCEVKRFLPNVSFGVAGYDVDFDSSLQGCTEIGIKPGAFNGLSGVRELNDFLFHDYGYNGHVGCLGLNFTTSRAA